METERIVGGLIDRTLPKSEWTHHAHLRAGLWHLLHHPWERALELLRERIRAYNESVGGVNSDTSGYHETITRFYLHVIGAFLAAADRDRPLEALAEELIAQRGERDLVLHYYSRERLFSPAARRGWIEPERQPLPGAAAPDAPRP